MWWAITTFTSLSWQEPKRYEGPLEREVLSSLRDPQKFGMTLLNCKGVATHRSGTAVDVAMASANAESSVNVGIIGRDGLRTDHALLTIRLAGVIEMTAAPAVGRAKWVADGDWDDALAGISFSLTFIAGWAGSAMRSTMLRSWVASGSSRRARQSILDRVVWWRAVVYTICGHFAGLVVAAGPRNGRRNDNVLEGLLAELGRMEMGSAVGTQDERDLQREELVQGDIAKKHAKRVSRYFELVAKSRGDADAYLSGLIKPKAPVQVALEVDGSHEKMGPGDTLDLLTQDVLSRGSRAGTGDAVFNRVVEKEVKAARAEAQADAGKEVEEPFSLELVVEILNQIQGRKRSMHLPRGASKSISKASRFTTWAIINLAAVMGLVATMWAREISPLRKGGPTVVTDVA